MRVVPITLDRTADAVAFLEKQTDTALFLLSNLKAFGPAVGTAPFSGDFKGVVDATDRLLAVFCLTRRGVLLLDGHGRSDLAILIVEACRTTGIGIDAVIGERRAADSVWPLVKSAPGFAVTWESPELLYRLNLAGAPTGEATDARVRRLTADDFAIWNDTNLAYLTEVGMTLAGSTRERLEAFVGQTALGHWWGLFENDRMLTTATLNAVYKGMAQVGAVYTIPSRRREGLARATMHALIADARDGHGLASLVLFTGESNQYADELYRSLAFEVVGEYGVYFGANPRHTGGDR